MTEQFIRLGSVVLDRARNKPLQVVDRDHRTAGEHPYIDVDGEMERQWGVTESDEVFECVFLPTGEDAVSSPSKSYAYPASRLTRYPVEAHGEGDDVHRIHTQIIVEFLADVFAHTMAADEKLSEESDFDWEQSVADAVIGARVDAEVPTEVLVEEARELADAMGGGRDA